MPAIEGRVRFEHVTFAYVPGKDVLKGLKGSATETLQFTVPGGRAGRYTNLIPGAPTFARGDVAVISLATSFRDGDAATPAPQFEAQIDIDLSKVERCLAGPRRPHRGWPSASSCGVWRLQRASVVSGINANRWPPWPGP